MPKVFFFLISQKNLLKAQRGATLSTQGVYRGGLGGKGEKREKLRKTNHPRGQPARCPREEGEKEKVNKLLSRSRRVLKTFVVSLSPNTPHNTKRNHFPHNSTPGTTTRPPTSKELLDRPRHDLTKAKPDKEGIPQGSRCPTMEKKVINRLPIRFA
jgi:hypothetical protein